MKKLLQAVILGTIALVCTVSCTMERPLEGPIDGPEPSGEYSKVTFKVSIPVRFEAPATRALTQTQEKAVTEMDVLVFDTENNLVNILHAEGLKATSTGQQFTVSIPRGVSEIKTFNLVALANSSATIQRVLGESIDDVDLNNRTLARVSSMLTEAISGAMYPSGGVIPMWGEARDVRVSGDLTEVRLKLYRAVSRIDIGVGRASASSSSTTDYPWSWNGKDDDGKTIPFVLSEVIVMRPNNLISLIPARANQDVTGLVVAPSVPAANVPFTVDQSKELFRYDTSVKKFSTQEIYIPETKLVGGRVGDAKHTERTALVIGGKYKGSATTTYYRIDFVEESRLVDLLRNHLYRFSIMAVEGPGMTTPEEAFASDVSVQTELVYWEEGLVEEIRFGDDKYLALSNNPAELAADQGANLVVNIFTNAGDFEMFLGGSQTAGLSSKRAAEGGAAGQTFNGSTRFAYTLRAISAQEYTLSISTKSSNISASQGAARLDEWRIVVGNRFSMPFEVTQLWHAPVVQPPAMYSVAVGVNDSAFGSAIGSTSSAKQGDPVTVLASASTGYVFAGWSLVDVPAGFELSPSELLENPLNFTMPAGGISIRATFEAVP